MRWSRRKILNRLEEIAGDHTPITQSYLEEHHPRLLGAIQAKKRPELAEPLHFGSLGAALDALQNRLNRKGESGLADQVVKKRNIPDGCICLDATTVYGDDVLHWMHPEDSVHGSALWDAIEASDDYLSLEAFMDQTGLSKQAAMRYVVSSNRQYVAYYGNSASHRGASHALPFGALIQWRAEDNGHGPSNMRTVAAELHMTYSSLAGTVMRLGLGTKRGNNRILSEPEIALLRDVKQEAQAVTERVAQLDPEQWYSIADLQALGMSTSLLERNLARRRYRGTREGKRWSVQGWTVKRFLAQENINNSILATHCTALYTPREISGLLGWPLRQTRAAMRDAGGGEGTYVLHTEQRERLLIGSSGLQMMLGGEATFADGLRSAMDAAIHARSIDDAFAAYRMLRDARMEDGPVPVLDMVDLRRVMSSRNYTMECDGATYTREQIDFMLPREAHGAWAEAMRLESRIIRESVGPSSPAARAAVRCYHADQGPFPGIGTVIMQAQQRGI